MLLSYQDSDNSSVFLFKFSATGNKYTLRCLRLACYIKSWRQRKQQQSNVHVVMTALSCKIVEIANVKHSPKENARVAFCLV